METYFKNASGGQVGWISGNDVKNNGGNRVGIINGNDIKDSGGNRIGSLNGNDIKDTYGNRVGYISGSDIKDTYGNRVGYAESGASNIEMCAAGLLLLDLESNSGRRISSYSGSSSGTSGESGGSGWDIIGLLLFGLWHFIKGPFVAFSLIKEPATRKEWWGTFVRSLLLGLLFSFILGTLFGSLGGNSGFVIAILFCLVFMILPIVVVSIRRMHDMGKSGWWVLIPIVSIVMCGFYPSIIEGNKYNNTKCGFGSDDTAPGKKMLKVTGILFIVFSAFGIISLISSIIASRMANELGVPPVSGFTAFLSVLSVLLGLLLGITGVMYCNNIKKAKLLRYFAFGYIGFYFVSAINGIVNLAATMNNMTAEYGGDFSMIGIASCIGMIIGFAIPVIYLIGAQKNLKADEGKKIKVGT